MFFLFKKLIGHHRLSILIFSMLLGVVSSNILAATNAQATTSSAHHKHTVKHHAHKKNTHAKHAAHHKRHVHHAAPAQLTKLNNFIPSSECVNPVTEDSTDDTRPNVAFRFAATVEKDLVNFVHKTVSTLHYSSYKLGGKKFDPARGVYIVDCSNFVDHVLQETSPHAYSSLVSASGADMPATFHYYNFFTELSSDPDNYWNKVNDVSQLRAGDILVFRYKSRRGTQTGGHVMVVMDKPLRDDNVYLVRVADSARSGHSEDTRPDNTSGIGIGTLLLKTNPKTGRPSAFAWGLNSYWNKNVSIAMARPIDGVMA